MDDVELVIKIPEESYIALMEIKDALQRSAGFEKFIVNGTPLPKGHGKLKDADAICKDIISALGIRDENYLLEAEEAVYKRIKNADTIIEADKKYEAKVITRGNCMLCGKELTEGLFLCKECGDKANSRK